MDSIEGIIERNDMSTLTDIFPITDSIYFERKDNNQVRKTLRKKLITVKQEKQTLEEAISAKNTEIEDLKKSVSALNDLIKSVPIEDLKLNSRIASSKIFELNKKNRQLHSDLDSVKNKNKRLESKIQTLEAELKKTAEKKRETVSQNVDCKLEDLESKLKQTKQKLFDSLNQNVELKNQLKLAQKCIQQEIGENMNLNILVASGTTWRGRAQQILTLQLKINELKGQLDNVRSEFGWPEDNNCPDEPHVRRDVIYHRFEIESLQNDITSLKAHLEEQNQKIGALKARNTNLVSDAAILKDRLTHFETLTQTSDGTIEALKERLEIQKFHNENKISEYQKQLSDMRIQNSDFEFDRKEMQIKLENLQIELGRREEHIADLNATIQKLERDLKSICGDYLFECRNFKKEEFTALLEALETEKKNLLDLNKTMNERLDRERSRILSLIDQISKQKVKICRLEGKLRNIEKEHDIQTDKKRRSQRISDYVQRINSNTSIVQSFVFENKSFTDIPLNNKEEHDKDNEIEELKNKLEISKEKITILEEKLHYLNEEKQCDTKTFENIIKMSKTVLLDTINQIKDQSCTAKLEENK